MPAPAAYAIGFACVIGAVAAGLAFKEFVYEPHLAPKLEQWAEEFIEKRRARRRQLAESVSQDQGQSRGAGDADEGPSSSSLSVPYLPSPQQSRRRPTKRDARGKKRSDSDDEYGVDAAHDTQYHDSIELENLVAKEVQQWRLNVDRSQSPSQTHQLRHRHNARTAPSSSLHTLDEPLSLISTPPMAPTHVLYDPSVPSTPSSTVSSRASLKPSAPASPVRRKPSMSTSTLRSSHLPSTHELPATSIPSPNLPNSDADANVNANASSNPNALVSPPPTSELSSLSLNLPQFNSPRAIPSLSQSYPQELDQERGIELLSPPSSRADSPFSNVSRTPSASMPPGDDDNDDDRDSAQRSFMATSQYHSFASLDDRQSLSPGITNPDPHSDVLATARPPSRLISEIDFLSDLEPDGVSNGNRTGTSMSMSTGVLSPRSSSAFASDFDDRATDDGIGSESSWVSAGSSRRP